MFKAMLFSEAVSGRLRLVTNGFRHLNPSTVSRRSIPRTWLFSTRQDDVRVNDDAYTADFDSLASTRL